MSRLSASMSVAALCVAAALSTATGDDGGAIVTPTGVSVRTHIEAGSRLVVSVVPASGVRLNGRLGVGFALRDGPAIWIGELPSVVTIEGDYFERPVLHALAFDPDRLEEASRLAIVFGACLPASGVCVLEEAEVTLERRGGAIVPTLALVEP